ncbi:mechanosensitive ion channel family protein [Aerosakkonemataceae cyanobacterium BLCC-F154]|uniref:Mechanosensitive ion channel family protein n=1 Tax=Floridaenema fluviatile BLCC-F154 TaxID=3153640 RepID=A0ABV4Y8F3_9CYAN
MSWLIRFGLRKIRSLKIITLSFILGCVLSVMPVLAQQNATAPVTLDGRELFKLSQLNEFDAQQRANNANQILNQAVASSNPVEVGVERINNFPVIQVNGANLVTVTDKDVPVGVTKEEQAERWQKILQAAINQAQKERRPGYNRYAALVSLGCVLVAIFVTWLLNWFWKNWLIPLLPAPERVRETAAPPKVHLLAKLVLGLLRLGIWLSTLLYIANLFPPTRVWSQRISNFIVYSLAEPIVNLGNNSFSVIQIAILVGLFLGLLSLTKVVRNLLRSRILHVTGMTQGDQETIATIANYTLVFIGTILLLQLWGLDLGSLTIFAGVLGVGIGLGLQGIAREFVSGLVIIFERPIQVGDFINVGEFMGTVERISVRSTEIRTLERLSIIVPNSHFLEKEVINWSHGSPIALIKLPVRIAYHADLKTVRQALLDAAKDHPEIVSDPPPNVLFKSYAENYLNLDLIAWITEPKRQFLIKSDIYFRIDEIFRERNIEVPYPRQELHLRSGNLPVELSPELETYLTKLLDNKANS